MSNEDGSEATYVYRLFNESDDLLYVGISNNIKRRFTEHSCKPWFADVARSHVQEFPTRKSALVHEALAIVSECPTHNVHEPTPVDIAALLDGIEREADGRSAAPEPEAASQNFDDEVQPPGLTIGDVAEYCGVSRSTVRRYRESDRFPNAYKDPFGMWKIPVPDLLAVGWTPVDPDAEGADEVAAGGRADAAEVRVRELENLVELERVKREAAERIADLATTHLEDTRRIMRTLSDDYAARLAAAEARASHALGLAA